MEILIILAGVLILLYKNEGFYGWERHVDKSYENYTIKKLRTLS